MLAIVEQVKQELSVPYGQVCRELAVPYSSLMRWKRRQRAGVAVVRRPGPAKIGPLDLNVLQQEITQLVHHRKRTQGTGALYARHRDAISRRDLQALVAATRRELRQQAEALERRIDWLVPGVVWSLDDTKKHWLSHARFGHVHLVLDLASHYQLRALADEELAKGWQVALNLEELFAQYGPPLFLKMDGGGNLNHHAVRGLLAQTGVIPLVSPPHYPPYNGGVERGHQEMLRHLDARLSDEPTTARVLQLECALTAHELNHKRRRSLGGRTACRALEIGRPLVKLFDRRKRKEVFEEITALTVDIAERQEEHTQAAREIAYRYAAETWMQQNHMIRVTRNGEVLPTFYRFQSH